MAPKHWSHIYISLSIFFPTFFIEIVRKISYKKTMKQFHASLLMSIKKNIFLCINFLHHKPKYINKSWRMDCSTLHCITYRIVFVLKTLSQFKLSILFRFMLAYEILLFYRAQMYEVKVFNFIHKRADFLLLFSFVIKTKTF